MRFYPQAEIENAKQIFNEAIKDPSWSRRLSQIYKIANRESYSFSKNKITLLDLIKHATEKVPFYIKHFRDMEETPLLESFPVIGKIDIVENFPDFIAAPYQAGTIDIMKTGGSTGVPVAHLKCIDDEFVMEKGLRMRLFNYLGINPKGNIIDVSPRVTRNRNTLYEPFISVDFSYPEGLIWKLRKYDPNNILSLQEYCSVSDQKMSLIFGAPSRIEGFVEFLNVSGIKPKAEYVVTTYEQLTQQTAKQFSSMFDCPVISLYGTTESGLIGWECSAGNIHIESDLIRVECLDLEEDKPALRGRVGRLVVTSIKSWLMPVIRYDTGDLATMGIESCVCGRKGEYIKKIEGRLMPPLIGRSGIKFSPYSLIGAINAAQVHSYQVIQKKKGSLSLVLAKKVTPEVELKINSELKRISHDFPYEFDLSIEDEANFHYSDSGKRNLFVSLI